MAQSQVPWGLSALNGEGTEASWRTTSTVPASPGCFELHADTAGVMGYVGYREWPPYTP